MANGTSNVSFRIDTEIKNQADRLFAQLGLNMTTAFNMFLRQAIREGAIPFYITINTPNSETVAAIEDVNQNRNMSRTFHSVVELMEDLDADD